jgi:putative endonuclease
VPRSRKRIPVREWTDARHVRGFAGERLVLRALERAGWIMEAHRFRAGRHDIDLVARRGDLVAFVEVKTRSGKALGHPEEAIGWRKRRALAWAATIWAARYGRPGDRYRFDVVSVILGGGDPQIRHLADAWRP